MHSIGGAALNENKFTAGEEALIGKRIQGAPSAIYNLWIDYKFSKGLLNNIRVGGGGNYVSKVYWDVANTVTIPDYTVINASVLYDAPKWNLGLKLNHLTNQKYWNSDAQPQTPRSFIASLGFIF